LAYAPWPARCGAADAEADDVAAGQAMQGYAPVKKLGAVAAGRRQGRRLPFGVGIAQQRDVVVRRIGGLGGLGEDFRAIGKCGRKFSAGRVERTGKSKSSPPDSMSPKRARARHSPARI